MIDSLEKPPASILWARLDSIGDNVLASSMLPALTEKFQQARLTIFCQQHVAELYETCPHVEEVLAIDLPRARSDQKYLKAFNRQWRQRRPDLVLNSVFSRDPFTDRLIAATGAPLRIGLKGDLANSNEKAQVDSHKWYHKLVESHERPALELERHADFLKALGCSTPALQPLVWTSAADEQFAVEFFDRNDLALNSALALFIGAQWEIKLYDRFIEALQPFMEHPLLLLGGASEVDRAEQFRQAYRGVAHNLAGKTSLRQMAALLRRCRLLLSTDSAGGHIAAAVGTPQVVILGGGHFGRFFPYAPSTTIVCLPLDCYHCNWRCKFTRAHCIQDISPEVIARAVTKALEGPGEKPRVFVQSHASPGFGASGPQGEELGRFLDLSTVEAFTEVIPAPRPIAPPPKAPPARTTFSQRWRSLFGQK